MKKRARVGLLFGTFALAGLLPTAPAQNAKSLTQQLVGTWECLSPEKPKRLKHIKHITPTHFTWVTYNHETKTPLASAGGTWSVQDGKYTERIDFASETYKDLRGKEHTYDIEVKDDRWSVRSQPGSGIDVNEVWRRAR